LELASWWWWQNGCHKYFIFTSTCHSALHDLHLHTAGCTYQFVSFVRKTCNRNG